MSKLSILALYLGLALSACGDDDVSMNVDMKMKKDMTVDIQPASSDMKGCEKDKDCSWIGYCSTGTPRCLQPSVPPGGERFCSCL
jgi:hypothetical protein